MGLQTGGVQQIQLEIQADGKVQDRLCASVNVPGRIKPHEIAEQLPEQRFGPRRGAARQRCELRVVAGDELALGRVRFAIGGRQGGFFGVLGRGPVRMSRLAIDAGQGGSPFARHPPYGPSDP